MMVKPKKKRKTNTKPTNLLTVRIHFKTPNLLEFPKDSASLRVQYGKLRMQRQHKLPHLCLWVQERWRQLGTEDCIKKYERRPRKKPWACASPGLMVQETIYKAGLGQNYSRCPQWWSRNHYDEEKSQNVPLVLKMVSLFPQWREQRLHKPEPWGTLMLDGAEPAGHFLSLVL